MRGAIIAVERDKTHSRAALILDGRLDALEIDRLDDPAPQVGAVYRCKITDMMPSIGAAFADLGAGQGGFFPDGRDRKPGETVLAQVRREAEGNKAARLSTDIQLQGTLVVFTPGSPGINVSRKIDEAPERDRLKSVLEPLGEQGGFVIRTRAKGVSENTLLQDAKRLLAIHERALGDKCNGLIVAAPDAFARILVRAALGTPVVMNAHAAAHVDRSDGLSPDIAPTPFDDLDIERQIDLCLSDRFDLKEGWLSVEATAALVAVDVNTAEAREGDARMRVNLDAAHQLGRALALRRFGGTVMIDFAGEPKGKARKLIEQALIAGARSYLDFPQILGWGPAGLLEIRCRRPGCTLIDLIGERDDAP